MVSCKELGTPENPAVLEDSPANTSKDVINLLCYSSGIVKRSPALQLWSLIPRAVGVSGTRAMVTNTYLVASSLSASGSIEVVPDNECVPTGALIQNRVQFSVEHLFLVSPTHLGRSIHCNKRHGARSVLQRQLHFTLINQNNLNNGRLQSARDAYSYSPKTGTIAHAGPVVGKTSAIDLATTRLPRLRESHYIHPQPTELI